MTRLPIGAGRPAATSRRGPVSDERLLRALVKEISRLMAEEGRRGVGERRDLDMDGQDGHG